jgi:hypothetical protein
VVEFQGGIAPKPAHHLLIVPHALLERPGLFLRLFRVHTLVHDGWGDTSAHTGAVNAPVFAPRDGVLAAHSNLAYVHATAHHRRLLQNLGSAATCPTVGVLAPREHVA